MGRTGGYWEQDLPFPDGHLFIQPTSDFVTNGTATITSAFPGSVYFAMAASQTVVFNVNLNNIIFRYGKQDDAQQQFGLNNPVGGFQGAQSQPTPPAVFTTPWGPGRPPQPSVNINKPLLSRPKGISIKNIYTVYSVVGADLTDITVDFTKTVFGFNVPPVITTLLFVDSTVLPLNPSIYPFIAPAPVPPSSQAMLVDKFSQYIIRTTFIIPAGSTANLTGWFLDIAYNYN